MTSSYQYHVLLSIGIRRLNLVIELVILAFGLGNFPLSYLFLESGGRKRNPVNQNRAKTRVLVALTCSVALTTGGHPLLFF